MIANNYAGADLFIPTHLHPTVRDACGADKPFLRQIDAWWLGLCVGIRLAEKIQPTPANQTKFNTGAILGSDPWRITHIELLAVAEEGQEVLEQPSRVLNIASAYANAGLEWLVENCLIGNVQPIVTIANKLGTDQLGRPSA